MSQTLCTHKPDQPFLPQLLPSGGVLPQHKCNSNSRSDLQSLDTEN